MPRECYIPRGVIPANLLPFTADLAIDEAAYRRHLRDLAGVPGITAITVNGHAAEVTSLSREERRRALAIAVDEVGNSLPVIAGIYADGALAAMELARDARMEGARALLVFPPSPFMSGVQDHPALAVAHFSHLADAVDLPLIAFQYPIRSGLGYTTPTLVDLAERVPTVVAIKDWSMDIVVFERNVRALHALGRPFSVLTTYSQALLPSLVLGADGILSGHGSIIAPLQVALWEAIQEGDLRAAQAVAARLFPLTEVFYAAPFLDMHNRMKEALVMLGRLPAAHVRPPLLPLRDDERARIQQALMGAGLLQPVAASVTR